MKIKQSRRPIYVLAIIVLLVKSSKASKACETSAENSTGCDYSEEAVSSGFVKFLQKTYNSYFELFPSKIYSKDGLKREEIKRIFKPFNPSPNILKNITDTARKLLNEIKAMKINMTSLKVREKKALFQIKHYLQFNFGSPSGVNYYAGDFLMGPDSFCSTTMCFLDIQVYLTLSYYKPKEVQDLNTLKKKLSLFKEAYETYLENIRYGVRAGMVRGVDECKAGLDQLKTSFFFVAHLGSQAIFQEFPVQIMLLGDRLFSNIINKTEDIREWETKHNKTIKEAVKEWILEYVGKPVDKLYKYLENDHPQYCIPNKISGGLGSLPLSYIYKNGTNTGIRTTKTLPTGEPLDGKKSYEMIMPYHTTNDMSPDDVHKLGFEMLNKLYPQVLEIARQVTNQNDNDKAKELFIKRINQSDMYFTNEPIPQNESDSNAHKLCNSIENAKKYCPKRWAAMQRWFDEAYRDLSLLESKTIGMFHFNGYKQTVPSCPVELVPNFNPSAGYQSYLRSGSDCYRPSYYNIPFFLDRPGPKYEEMSVNAHEGRPGHHTQVQGIAELFRDKCGGIIRWLDRSNSYTAFSEGWGLYAENPLIAKDTDIYDKRPFDKYGMLKWQLVRALRLIVDTGLHYKNFTRQDALKFFADYAWDTTDKAEKEVTRYQSNPGQATAYMVGQLQIIKLRDYAKSKLKEKFNLADFHFYLFSQGEVPLGYLKENIEQYVDCTLDGGKRAGCHDVLNPVTNDLKTAAPTMAERLVGMVDDTEWINGRLQKSVSRHYI